MSTLAQTFESLRVRNYRLFFSGQVVSWTGTWVAWVAQGWLVLQLTGSGFGLEPPLRGFRVWSRRR